MTREQFNDFAWLVIVGLAVLPAIAVINIMRKIQQWLGGE